MLSTMKNAFKVKDIRNKILFTLMVLVVFRLGSYITVPGVNAKALQSVASSGLVSILNMFSGGGLTNYSIFAMGYHRTLPRNCDQLTNGHCASLRRMECKVKLVDVS